MRLVRYLTLLPALAALLLGAAQVSAQESTGSITGRVIDSSTQRPISGASVTIEGTQRGVITRADGTFLLTAVPVGSHQVRASQIGFVAQTREVTIAAGAMANVAFQLVSQAIELEGIVAVGYGEQRKATMTGSVAAVSGEVLEKAPATNLSNAISGKLPGVVTVNASGEPGYDGATIRIRGNHTLNDNSPLVVIDGVPGRAGGLERINPQDIESISVLKDASAAIYGSRAANGVILVTTKRGREGGSRFAASFNQGFNQPTRLPRMADAATYMTMLNEIDLYRNRDQRYSQELIQNFRDGTDPWLYPNTDWFGEVIKPMSLQSRGDISLSGGAERIRYYLSLGGLTEDGYYENSATRFNQYSFRSNIDGDVTDHISLRFDVTGRLEDRNFPNRSAGAVFRSLMRGKPNLPAYWPNGLPGPDIEYGDNPVVIGTPATGYDNDERYYVQGNLGVDLKVPGVTGLTVRANAAYDQLFRYQKQWRTPWTLYTWDYVTRDANGEPVLQPAQRGYSSPELNQFDERSTGILLNVVANYQRDFGPHTIGLLGGAERQTSNWSNLSAFRRYYISDQLDQIFAGGDAEKNNSGTAGVAARQNYFTRVNYGFQDKYLLEFVGRYDGSYIFPKEGRYGFFPAVSAGWRITEEPFFRNRVALFDELKLRGSVGQTGNDRINEWQYMASYGFGGGYVFGGNTEVRSIFQTRTPNPNVTWEVANQRNIGIDGSLLDRRLSFELDYFNYLRSQILHWRNASVPQTTGLSLPRENIGEVASWGYDGSLTWRQNLPREASYHVTLNAGYNQNRINFWDEPPGAPEWQRSTGSKMNTGLFYQAIGVFKDSADLARYPHWRGARPGDIIFADINGDGVINAEDRVRVNSNGEPTFVGGLTLGGQMRNLDLTVFFQGATGAVQYMVTESGDIGNYFQDFAENRWRPDAPSSTHPRAFNRQDEYWISNRNTYWLRETDYLRLKTLEVGYTMPQRMLSRVGMQNLRVYGGGFNLLTWDKFKLTDPEARSESGQFYPQKRVFNVGASATF
jgi:TonB-dependent starch-binding outer membrane protein SusC